MEKTKVMVKRDTYEKNGKSYFTYFINGKVRGVDVTAKVTPPDNGGYTLLEIVFGKEQEAELVCKTLRNQRREDGFCH